MKGLHRTLLRSPCKARGLLSRDRPLGGKLKAYLPALGAPVSLQLVAEMKAFLLTLIAARRTKTAVKKYADCLRIFG